MRNIIAIFIFLLPLHAFLVTIFKCKFGIDTNILRFWKELAILVLLLFTFFRVYSHNNWSLKEIYKNNTLLSITTAFIVCSIIYIFFPFFELKAASVLGFRYDAFFLLAMIIWLYCGLIGDLRFFMRTLFISAFGIIAFFLPWYLFGDISNMAHIFGYSGEVSTYSANSCISFSQNVNGQHRFQWTFWGPIRFSVFLTVVWSLFSGWILSSDRFSSKQKKGLMGWFLSLILISIFFSYSKTSILGAFFTLSIFILLTYKYIYRKKITRKFYYSIWALFTTPVILVAIFKWELFLHLGAIINRLDNLKTSLEMFFYNPIGYGLGIAWPASQIWNSIESAGSWQVATASVLTVHKFLPENWYVQITLEQWIVGISLFISVLLVIGIRLVRRIKKHRDFLSVWIASAFFALCFMSLFTHAFEEAATSYILFFFIGIVLTESMTEERVKR